jgi:1,4-alpha-glucan branching enzyme
MSQFKAGLLLVLHAHLPYIHHPDFEQFMEERWLFEAITETYIPLIKVFKSLEKDKIPFNLTISFSPPLMEMLTSNSLQTKYLNHLSKLIELTEKEIQRTKNEDPKKMQIAKFYRQEFIEAMKIYSDQYNQNILKAFKEFQDKGYIEVITSNGTHSYLPLYREYPEAIRAQLKVAISTFKENFGKVVR